MNVTLRSTLAAVAASLVVCAAPAGAGPISFTTPDEKVACFFDEAHKPAFVYCDWSRRDDRAAKVRVRGPAKLVRAGGAILPGGPVLRHGRTKRVGKLRCTARHYGVRCWSARSSHGFRVGRAIRPALF